MATRSATAPPDLGSDIRSKRTEEEVLASPSVGWVRVSEPLQERDRLFRGTVETGLHPAVDLEQDHRPARLQERRRPPQHEELGALDVDLQERARIDAERPIAE